MLNTSVETTDHYHIAPGDNRLVLVEGAEADPGAVSKVLGHIDANLDLEPVRGREAFNRSLNGQPRMVISATNPSGLNYREVLSGVDRQAIKIPLVFLFPSGSEDRMLELMKLGATDCVAHNHLDQLPRILWRALRETEEIRDRWRAEQWLRHSQEHLEMALQGAEMGSWEWNVITNQLIHNRGWAHMLGYQQELENFTLEGIMQLIHPDDQSAVVAKLLAHMKGHTPAYRSEYRMLTNNGDWIWVRDRGKVVECDAAGNPLRMAGTVLNISAQKHTEQQLEQTSRELELVNRDLEELTYVLSHNLRAPVANLLGLVHLFNTKTKKDNAREDIVQKIGQSANALSGTLNELTEVLTMRRTNEEKVETVRFEDILTDVMEAIRPQVNATNMLIRYNFKAVTSMRYRPGDLYSILVNLLSNAVKFRNPGTARPLVQVNTVRKRNHVCLIVRDNGMGIDLASAGGKVFGMFQRLNKDGEGKGLGLYIMKSLVESQGGYVELNSAPGKGTVFKVFLRNDLS